MRLNPIRIIQDYSKKREIREALLKKLRQIRQPGVGIDLEMSNPLHAAVAMELVQKYPFLTVFRFKDGMQLGYKADLFSIPSGDLLNKLTQSGFFVQPGDDLVEQAIVKQVTENKAK